MTVRVERDGRVGILVLDDPERRNVMTAELVDAIVGAMDGLEADEAIGAVVVTGAPPAFCAGADLSHLGGAAGGPGVRAIYEGFLRVARSPLPTMAAVNGPAVGAGMNLALACDVRVAGRSARFITRFLELGLHPGGGHTWMLQRLAGPQTAAAAVLFGEAIDGEDAVRLGLAWRCVDDADLWATAVALAGKAAAAPRPLAVRVKETLRAVPGLSAHDDAVDLELEAQTWSGQQPFFQERLAAMQARLAAKQP